MVSCNLSLLCLFDSLPCRWKRRERHETFFAALVEQLLHLPVLENSKTRPFVSPTVPYFMWHWNPSFKSTLELKNRGLGEGPWSWFYLHGNVKGCVSGLKLTLKHQKRAIFWLCQYLYKKVLFSSNLLLLGAQPYSWYWFALYQKRSKQRWCLTYFVFDTFATHSGLVYDVTDTDCWAQNGSNQSYFVQLLNIDVLTNWVRSGVKQKTAVCRCFIPFLSVGPMRLIHVSPPLRAG